MSDYVIALYYTYSLQVQHVPLSVGLQRIGMTPEAFRAIQEAAEAKFQQAQEV